MFLNAIDVKDIRISCFSFEILSRKQIEGLKQNCLNVEAFVISLNHKKSAINL